MLFRSVTASVGTQWSTTDPVDARNSTLQVGGTEGTIVSWPLHDKFSRGRLLVARERGEDEIHVPEASTHVALLDDFASARASDGPFPITGADGLAAQQVVDAAYESSRTGRAVRP